MLINNDFDRVMMNNDLDASMTADAKKTTPPSTSSSTHHEFFGRVIFIEVRRSGREVAVPWGPLLLRMVRIGENAAPTVWRENSCCD